MAIDLNELTQKELDTLITQAKRRKATLKKRKPIATVRSRITAQAEAEGYTIEELFGTGTATRNAIIKVEISRIFGQSDNDAGRAVTERLRSCHLVAHRGERVKEPFVLHFVDDGFHKIRALACFL